MGKCGTKLWEPLKLTQQVRAHIRAVCRAMDDIAILEHTRINGGTGCNWFGDDFPESVTHAMPESTWNRLALVKMRQLMRRGLVEGCRCGCRGDFELTDKGRELLAAKAHAPPRR